MAWLLVCATIAACASAAAAVRLLTAAAERERRQHAREREMLLNQIMHLAGRTWAPPPADDYTVPADPFDEERYMVAASQEPEGF